MNPQDIHIEAVRAVASELKSAFVWVASPQGHDAWENVYRALMDLADAEERNAARRK